MRWTLILILMCLASCSADLINVPATTEDFRKPSGVPWIESRSYHVYAFVLIPGKGTSGEDVINDRLLKYDRYDLGDKVNGLIVDENRPKYMTNYDAWTFSDAGLTLVLHPNQALKEVKLTSTGRADAAAKSAAEVLGTLDKIEGKKLERLKREKEIQDIEKALGASEK